MDETINKTIQARTVLALPEQYVILYDHHDGGVILLDTFADEKYGNHKVIDTAWQSIPEHIEQEIIYPTFMSYVQSIINSANNKNEQP